MNIQTLGIRIKKRQMNSSSVYEEKAMFVIEGTITDFRCAISKVNLLQDMKLLSPSQSFATGAAGVMSGMDGITANSVMLLMYDGEDVQSFTCRIGGKVVCGQFAEAHRLIDGTQVKAVVTQEDDILFTHAVVRPEVALLWLPVGVDRGTVAQFKSEMIFSWWICLMTWIFSGLGIEFAYLVGAIDSFLSVYVIFFITCPFLIFSIGFWVYHDLYALNLRATNIFRALGFPDPEKLDMRPARYSYFHREAPWVEGLFYYQRVLDAHLSGKKVHVEPLINEFEPATPLQVTEHTDPSPGKKPRNHANRRGKQP